MKNIIKALTAILVAIFTAQTRSYTMVEENNSTSQQKLEVAANFTGLLISEEKWHHLMKNLQLTTTRIDFTDSNYCGELSERIITFRHLQHISFQGCNFREHVWKTILKNLPLSIQSINFGGSNYMGQSGAYLKKHLNIKRINFTYIHMNKFKWAKVFSGLPESIEELDISNSNFSLPFIQYHDKGEIKNVPDSLKNSEYQEIMNETFLPNIRRFRCSHVSSNDSINIVFKCFFKSYIITLKIPHPYNITETQDFRRLCYPNIEEIDFSNYFSEHGCRLDIICDSYMPKLKKLSLANTIIAKYGSMLNDSSKKLVDEDCLKFHVGLPQLLYKELYPSLTELDLTNTKTATDFHDYTETHDKPAIKLRMNNIISFHCNANHLLWELRALNIREDLNELILIQHF